MSAELPYLKRIAEALKNMKGLGSASESSSQSLGALSITTAIDASGVADVLDTGLLDTTTEEQETQGGETESVEVKTSAIKSMADLIKGELLSAFFKEDNGTTINLLESIHYQLRNVSDYSTLQGLRDVNLTSGPNDGDFLVWIDTLNGNTWQAWTNIPASGILQQLLDSNAIGGADTNGDYHSIYWGGASFIPIPSGAIADPVNNSAAHYPIVGWQVYSYLSGKAAMLDVIKSTDLTNNDSYFPSLQGDGYIPTAYAVYTYLNKHYKIAASLDNLEDSGDLITGEILVAYVNEHGGSGGSTTLAGLDDVTIGTKANNDFLYLDKPNSSSAGVWKNCTRTVALQKLVNSSIAIGGGSTNPKPIYYTGSGFSAFSLGASAYIGYVTTASAIVSGESNLVTAGAVASKLSGFLQGTLKQNGSDINSSANQSDVPSCLAVYDFVTSRPDKYITKFKWTAGTTAGPVPKIEMSDNSTLDTANTNVWAIPSASASASGIVNTDTQTFAGAKTFSGAVTVSGLLTASTGISATGVVTGTKRPAITATGANTNDAAAISASGKVYVTGGNIQTEQQLEGAALVIPSSAPSGNYIESSKWYMSINASAISGTNPSSS